MKFSDVVFWMVRLAVLDLPFDFIYKSKLQYGRFVPICNFENFVS